MNGPVLIDTNLLILLIVGLASPRYIAMHKRLTDYSTEDYELLSLAVADFANLITVPHVLAEVSNLIRQIEQPAKARVLKSFRDFIAGGVIEFPAVSADGSARPEFFSLGLTDPVILYVCALDLGEASPTLLTVDRDLSNRAKSLGCKVFDYWQEYKAG